MNDVERHTVCMPSFLIHHFPHLSTIVSVEAGSLEDANPDWQCACDDLGHVWSIVYSV